MTMRDLVLSLRPSTRVEDAAGAVATLAFDLGGCRWSGRITEGAGVPSGREPYDEEALTRLCEVHVRTRRIRLHGQSALSFIETVVCMTKALHQAVWPDASEQWLFCRWDSEGIDDGPVQPGLEVRLARALGTRLTQSDASSSGIARAQVFFSARIKA
jgi:hypothetical protein